MTSCKPEKDIPKDIISQQHERIQKFIKGKGWKLTEKYVDRKKDSEAEDAFQNMRSDGLERKFDMVVIDSLFRCGRNVSYAEDVLMKTFYPAGIHFAVVEDDLCSMDMTSDEIKEYFKQKRNAYIGGAMVARTRRKQAEGYLSVHDEKYGYLLTEDKKGLMLDMEVVPILKEIFYLLAEKELTFIQVAGIMNERGVESPIEHLTRVGQKKRKAVKSKWVSGSVKRISENTAYIGYWKKVMDGETVILKTEPIIDKKQFDKVQNRFERKYGMKMPHGQRSNNAFIKQIFDKTTGRPLHCKLESDSEEIHQTFSYSHTCAQRIRYDDVMQATVATLRLEQKKAICAATWIDSRAGICEKDRQKAILSRQAQQLFEKITKVEEARIPLYCRWEAGEISDSVYELQKGEILIRLSELEEDFSALMDEVDMLEQAFSRRNPWIVFYRKLTIPDELTKVQIRQWIDRIVIENLEEVEVIFPEKYMQWKNKLPVECYNGMEEEQWQERADDYKTH
jgi:DNA invertase Pin-like site-specific DNA recombinase